MAPLREYKTFERYTDDSKIEPLKRYYLLAEGEKAEIDYFKGVINNRKKMKINPLTELIILEREGDLTSHSNPVRLHDLIERHVQELKDKQKFSKKTDKFVIIFDRDSYRSEERYLAFLEKINPEYIITVTSPLFELWLLLHFKGAFDNWIIPNESKIVINKRVSNKHTYTSKLFSDKTGKNSKSGICFEEYIDKIDYAITQEKRICQDNRSMFTKLGSNVGRLIEELKNETLKL